MDLDGRCASTPSTSAVGASALSNLTGFEANFVTIIAEQLGVELPHSASQLVAQEVSGFFRNVVKLARKFQRSGRRKWLASEDLEVAMAYYGYNPVIGYEPLDNVTFRQIGKQGRDLFVRDDPEMEIAAIISSTQSKLPLEATIKAHWLVINGTQPAIPENPLPPMPKEMAGIQLPGIDDGASTSMAGGGLLLNQLAKTVRKTEQVQIKSTTTHALSLEQQVFFLKIMEAIMGQDEQKRIEALNCLQTDCGLRTLLPRFSIAITEGVRCNIVVHNMAILVYLMRMIQALSQNAALSLEPCLHELLPAIMSCTLSRQLSSNQQSSDTHCVLREFSADLLAQLLRRYRLPHIHTRVIRALSRAFDDVHCSLPTLYGAALTLCELGSEVIQRVIVPNIPTISAAIQRVHSDKLYSHERSLSARLYTKMVEKLTAFAKDPSCELPLRSYKDYFEHFGDFADDIYKGIKNNGGQQQQQPQSNGVTIGNNNKGKQDNSNATTTAASSSDTKCNSIGSRVHNTRRSSSRIIH